MIKNYFLLVLFVCISQVFAQSTVADTQGELTVSGMGTANYKVPIALPPGIKDVAPQLALVYDSSSNNGVAGYGWSLVGISSINRMATRLDLDGYIDGVNFNENDQFALDGQRLLMEAGSNKVNYYTESFSNMKIESTGTVTYTNSSVPGPEKFVITFADGTQAFYGTTENSRGVSEWLIDRWVDVQGNTVKYEYEKSNNVTYVKKIKWSENELIGTQGYFNEIEFNYKTRLRPETAYLHGIKMTTNRILDYVTVMTGGQLFKKYVLTHSQNELNYQNVSQIQEFNGNNEAANPIVFGYDKTPESVIVTPNVYPEHITEADMRPQITGDFDGDGLLDVVMNGKIFLNIFNPLNGSTIISDFNLKNNFRNQPMSVLGSDGKLIQAQTVLVDTYNEAFGGDPALLTNHELYLTANQLNQQNNQFVPVFKRTVKYPFLNQWVKMWDTPCYNESGNGQTYFGSPVKKYIEGDFDGDGISDLIILGKIANKKVIVPTSNGAVHNHHGKYAILKNIILIQPHFL